MNTTISLRRYDALLKKPATLWRVSTKVYWPVLRVEKYATNRYKVFYSVHDTPHVAYASGSTCLTLKVVEQ